MKGGFYSRMAIDGIRKNRQLYLPYLMTCALMTAVYYILHFLSDDPAVLAMRGGSSIGLVLLLGRFVIVVFSTLFLFYTNSFLIRRRMKEFGLYNVLGMTKRNIGRILLREAIWSYLLSMGAGLLGGIALSKLAQLFLLRLMNQGVDYGFRIDPKMVGATLAYFAVIFLLIFLNALRQLRLSNPVELLKSENSGEKPPKARILLGVVGLILLGFAYTLAVSIQQPLEALLWFFVAVLMVILATYLLFITGSVVFCRLLQKRKSFYYRPRNFVSVSSMTFRMKRNGAGLASICILLTMVLVMLSSSACLYFGKDDALKARYPKDICAEATVYGYLEDEEQLGTTLRGICERELPEEQREADSLRIYREYGIVGLLKGREISFSMEENPTLTDYGKIVMVHLLPLSDYNAMTGKNVTLGEHEALLSAYSKEKLPAAGELFSLGGREYRIAERIDGEIKGFESDVANSVTTTVALVVKDWDECAQSLSELRDSEGTPMLYWSWEYQINTPLDAAALEEKLSAIATDMDEMLSELGRDFRRSCSSEKLMHDDFYGTYGGLFFIGILLSIVFLVACILMIYYKQLSEGYEDQSRFAIMQKVGMTKEDIRESINAQMLTVFMLPIAFAVLHLCFAFPMVKKVLLLFGVANTRLFAVTNLIGVTIILLFYTIVYRITGNAYYHIVSGGDNE